MPVLIFRWLAWMQFVSECCWGQTEALTRWFPARSYWSTGECWWIWSWGIFQCSECHILSAWTLRWKWATMTWVNKPWVARGRDALIQRYSVIPGEGRGVSCFCRMHPWDGVYMRKKVPKECFWGLCLLCCEILVQDDLPLLCHNRVLRQTQALMWELLHKGCNSGLGPPYWAQASQSCLSCILNKLGSGLSLQGCSWPNVSQLAEQGTEPDGDTVVMMTQRAEDLLQLFPGSSIVTPILKNCLHPPTTYLELRWEKSIEKAFCNLCCLQLLQNLGSWWAEGICRAKLTLRKKAISKTQDFSPQTSGSFFLYGFLQI